MDTILPADIYSLKKIGIDRLDVTKWPVSDDEFFSLVDAYQEAFENTLLALNPVLRGVLIADFSFVGFLAQASHARAVLGRVAKNGGRVEVGPLAQPFYFPEWKAQGEIKPHDFHGSRMGYRVKGLAKDLRFNNHLGLLGRITGSSRRVLGIGSFTHLKGEYAREHGLYVRNTYLRNLLPLELGNGSPPPALSSAVKEILTRLENVFADKFGFQLGLAADAVRCWEQRLGRLYIAAEALATHRNLSQDILVSETARPFHKAVAFGFRIAGGRAVGFHHGSSMGSRLTDTHVYNELAAYDTFVCPTRACADAYAESYTACRISCFAPLTVVAKETSYYKCLHRAMAKKRLPDRINTVMLMGFPMNAVRYQLGGPSLFFVFQLQLELRLARFLSKNGYKVLYKIHPERQDGIRDLMEPLCAQIITEPFEQCWERADAILIKYSSSSTFGFALCTNRPIVLLDHERSFWRPDQYYTITRRCRMVPAWVEDSRIGFDEGALADVLAKKPQPPDSAYVREFMYPT